MRGPTASRLAGSMTLILPRPPPARLARAGVVGGVALVVFIAYAVPFFGLLASLCLPFVTHGSRRHLWPDASDRSSIVWSILAWAGLWLPGLVDFFTTILGDAGVEVSTMWLVLPLCAPTGPGAVLLPALVAAMTGLAGLLRTVVTRGGWSWVVACWIAPWVHHLVFSQLSSDFIC